MCLYTKDGVVHILQLTLIYGLVLNGMSTLDSTQQMFKMD